MKRGQKKSMWIAIGALLVIIGLTMIFFNIKYSKTQKIFSNTTEAWINDSGESNDLFTEKDIENLPDIVQNYFRQCGFVGQPQMTYLKSHYKNVKFKMAEDKPD